MEEKDEEMKRMPEEEEAGRKGGAMEASMAEMAHTAVRPLAVPIGWISWNSVATGAAVALAITILLNSLGVAIGLSLTRLGYGGSLAYWMIGAAVVGLFIGSYLGARSAQVKTLWTGILHAVTIWAVFLLFDIIGVGLFGGLFRFLFAQSLQTAPLGAVRNIAMTSGWWFFLGYLIALIAAGLGGASGVVVEEAEEHPHSH